MSLDEKLKEVLIHETKHISTYEPHMENVIVNIEHVIPAIKQAFIDAGWVEFRFEPGAKIFTEEEGAELL